MSDVWRRKPEHKSCRWPRVSVAAQIFCGPCLISNLSYLKKIVVDEHAVPGSGGVDDDRRDLAIPVKYRK